MENYYGKGIKVRSFTKTNAVEIPPNGYSLEYEAQVECLSAIKRAPGDITIPENSFDVICERVGDVKKVTGKIRFDKTENGWRGKMSIQ